MKKHKAARWLLLDNAAKIFPSTSTKRDPKVFRFACELTEAVDPPVLQQAVDETLQFFPPFKTIMKRGMFWYYLEESKLTPKVMPEHEPPCSPIYDRNRKNLLFKVTYFRCRINLEVYHVLTDGTGAMEFLRAIICRYLVIRHEDELGETPPSMDYDASHDQKTDDSFQRYYDSKHNKKKSKTIKAYHIKGRTLPEDRVKVMEGVMPVAEVIKKAKEHGASLTVYLTAIFLCSVNREMSVRARRRPVVACIPVNLRNYFFSQSARNFFSIIEVPYDFGKRNGELADVIQEVQRVFQQELTRKNMEERLNSLVALEKNVAARVIPLFLKDMIMRAAYTASAQGETVSLSNIGRVSMPEQLRPYIRLFDVFVSTPRVQICMCSYEENLTVSFSSAFADTEIQKWFFRALTAEGIPVEVVTNPVDDE